MAGQALAAFLLVSVCCHWPIVNDFLNRCQDGAAYDVEFVCLVGSNLGRWWMKEKELQFQG